MSLTLTLLISLELLLVTVCNTSSVIKYFSSKYCPSKAYKISYYKKVFYLVWEGQVSQSALCRFTFESGYKTNAVCFESKIYDMDHLIEGVTVKITHNTEQTWKYDRNDNRIPRTCVPYAADLVVSITVPSGYRNPESRKYIKIKISGNKFNNGGNGSGSGGDAGREILSTIGGLVFCIAVVFLLSNRRRNIGDICNCIGEFACHFIQCKCCPECNTNSCDCSLSDTCQPCGECCSACPGCCTSLIVRERQDDAYPASQEESTAMTGVTDQQESGTITEDHSLTYNITEAQAPLNGVVVNSQVSSYNIQEHPPPSYETATDMTVSIYTSQRPPPPTYEEVIS